MGRRKNRNRNVKTMNHKSDSNSPNPNRISKDAGQIRDVNSKEIFGNNLLACQFLRDYSGISLFSDLCPEDLEDYTEHFRFLLGIEIHGDSVKKVRIRSAKEKDYGDVYVVALLEHKSHVDYDVAMQLFMYMAAIWKEYAKKENDKPEKNNKRKDFRYPLIIPIVYYEGKKRWTADMHLSDRIAYSELAKEYIPDFTYKVVPLRNYSNSEIKSHNNEMSLVMMINKIQTPRDFSEFLESAEKYMGYIYQNSSPAVRNIIINVLHGLLVKMNLPKEERNNVIKNLKENSDMGILFADLKGMDIQAVRRESNKVREELKDTKKKYNQAQAEKEQAQAQAEQFRVQLEYTMKENEEVKKYAKDTIDTSMVNYINKCKEEGKSRESTLEGLAFIFSKDVEQADMILSMYWGD